MINYLFSINIDSNQGLVHQIENKMDKLLFFSLLIHFINHFSILLNSVVAICLDIR